MADSRYEIEVSTPTNTRTIVVFRHNRQAAEEAAVWIAFEEDNDENLAQMKWGKKSEAQRFQTASQAGYKVA